MNQAVLILTHRCSETGKAKLPHLDWLQRTNPSATVKVVISEDGSPPKAPHYYWKNGDRPLRDWWRINGNRIAEQEIAVIEWDTLVACELPRLPDDLDLAGKTLHTYPSDWPWWDNARRLGLTRDQVPVGLVSFGAFFMRPSVLDAVCNPRWDKAYERSVQNELRFPTIASIEGARVGTIPLPFVQWHETALGPELGIYHAIKEPVPADHFDADT